MQAIRTQHRGPTNTRPSAIVATCVAGSIRVNYDDKSDLEENHKLACYTLCKKLGWTPDKDYPPMVGGTRGNCMYWVFLPKTGA